MAYTIVYSDDIKIVVDKPDEVFAVIDALGLEGRKIRDLLVNEYGMNDIGTTLDMVRGIAYALRGDRAKLKALKEGKAPDAEAAMKESSSV